jgi:hypothetical protein
MSAILRQALLGGSTTTNIRPHGALGHLTSSEYAKAGRKQSLNAADF